MLHYANVKETQEMAARITMISIFLGLFLVIGGFAVLAAWDVPVEQTIVEKTLDQSRFLNQ
jgi:hypothetical protein